MFSLPLGVRRYKALEGARIIPLRPRYLTGAVRGFKPPSPLSLPERRAKRKEAAMMVALQTFTYEGAHAVRTLEVNHRPAFVARDVAEVLGYKEGGKTFDHVPAKWKGVGSVPTPGGKQRLMCLFEEGLYFFVCRSDKPKARPFQEWLAGEVLPAIRRTGQYAVQPPAPATDHAALMAEVRELSTKVAALAVEDTSARIAAALGGGKKRKK